MGILNARPKLDPDEPLLWKAAANHVAGPSYVLWGMTSSAGGQLVVTDRRILFQPSRFDALVHQRRWALPLTAVEGFETVGRDRDPFAGGMRKRLGIRGADGVEVFVVNRLEEKITELRRVTGKPS